jgi:MoaA/NifB/PqqE/SkfB family radical SAM enzyme
MHPLVRETGRWVKRAKLRVLRALGADKARRNADLNQREIWQGRTRLDSFPREIQVGTNWTCNLRCFFCRRETAEKERLATLRPDQLEIPEAALERLMRIMPYAEVFTLTPLGEPLLYSGLSRILERSRAAGCRNLHLTTNGNATSESLARQLVEGRVRRIYVSIDTAAPERYAEMRVGGDLGKVSEGLCLLNEQKARLGAPTPEIVFASTFMQRNIGDLAGLVRFASDHRVETISVQLMEAEDPIFEPETLAHHIPQTVESLCEARRVADEKGVELSIHLALRNLLSAHAEMCEAAELLADQPALDTRGQTLMDKCLYPWTFLVVDTDGQARPCCWAGLNYGNLAEQPFEEIWNSPEARDMRQRFLDNIIPDPCRGKHCRVDLDN